MSVPTRRILEPIYGEASLADANNANANWVRGEVSPLDQKGQTGCLANLHGGIQTGDDWARVNIPVYEERVDEFSVVTGDTQWTWWQTNAEVYGVNLVIWMHDPKDPDKRVEVTQAPSGVTLEKGAGWNAHEFNPATVQMFFYGENTTGTDLTAGTQYTWNQFREDVLFKTWRIYRVTFEWGWYSTGTFESAYVADIKLNGVTIFLRPDSGGSGRIMRRFYTGSTALATAFAPKTPFRLLGFDLHLSSASSQETFTLKVDATRGTAYDTLLYSRDLSTATTDIALTFEGIQDFYADDVIDGAWTNTDTRTFGLTINALTVLGGGS